MYVTRSVVLNTPKVIQTYMPLFSPFIQGEFKLWLLNITMGI